MKAAVQALGHEPDQLEVAITQLVTAAQGRRGGEDLQALGRPHRAARHHRRGGAPTPTRLVYLLQSIDSPQTVDLAVIAAQSMDNPVFYVQMAHARCARSPAGRRARGRARAALAEVDLGPLVHERELEVLRR
jgi:arginyl-tRNA synthetase